MTLVADASAVIDRLVRSDRGDRVRAFLAGRADEGMATFVHLDVNLSSRLGRLYRADDLDADDVAVPLRRLGDLAVAQLPITARLLDTAWALRDNVAARDALYVAAAQALSADLVTTDDRLARAAGDIAVNLDGDQS